MSENLLKPNDWTDFSIGLLGFFTIFALLLPSHQNGTDMTEAKPSLQADRDAVRGLYTRLTTPPLRFGAGEDGVDALMT
jgi:hypothetical protein